MAILLPYIKVTETYAEVLSHWFNAVCAEPTFARVPFPKQPPEHFKMLMQTEPNHGVGENGVLEAAILGSGAVFYIFLVDKSLPPKRTFQAALSVMYWTLHKALESGLAEISWEQDVDNTFLAWVNEVLPPLRKVVCSRNGATGEIRTHMVTLDVRKALSDCEKKLRRL